VFNVHEIKTDLPGQERRPMKVLNDRLDFAVSEQRIIGRQLQAPIQERMVIKNARLRAGMFIRAAVPPRVRQLQTDCQAIVAARRQNMIAPQFGSQMRKTFLRSRGREKLIGVRSSFMGNRNRFSTPNQLAPTSPEPLPPPNGILRRRPVSGRIPTLHGLNRDPVADFEWAAVQQPAQRRFASGHDLLTGRLLRYWIMAMNSLFRFYIPLLLIGTVGVLGCGLGDPNNLNLSQEWAPFYIACNSHNTS
jgi:hypothetical protein